MTGHDAPAAPRHVTPALADALHVRILDWYAANRRDLPWRRTRDPYAILVSEVMLQQTQVPRVVPKYEAFLSAFPTLEALAAASLADVLQLWRGLGYNNRARRLWGCAVAVVAATQVREAPSATRAALPDSVEALRALPGIGPYTARAVLIFAHNRDLAAVDANVRRVLTSELELPAALSERELQAVADAVLPRGRSRDWHNALMDYGSLVLTARATGIAPRTRQGTFEGSRRWYRSRVLQALLDDGPQRFEQLAESLGLDEENLAGIVATLEADGLTRSRGGLVAVA
jgi:A/G-specific adenine glycosylase